jgi:hypothetical protein
MVFPTAPSSIPAERLLASGTLSTYHFGCDGERVDLRYAAGAPLPGTGMDFSSWVAAPDGRAFRPRQRRFAKILAEECPRIRG